MERGRGLYRYPGHAKQPSTSEMSLMQGNNPDFNASNFPNFTYGAGGVSATNTTGMLLPAPEQPPPPQQQQRRAPQSGVREQDQYLPIANVIRIMRKILPPHAKISDDAKETIQECVSEYISFVTGEANERCQREQRKTITADDVLWAMGKLGFDDYVEPLSLFLSRYRESENASLRDPILKRSAMEYASRRLPSYAPTFPTMPDHHNPGAYDPTMFAAYYRDQSGASASAGAGGSGAGAGSGSGAGAGGSSSQNAQANYDPFAHFK